MSMPYNESSTKYKLLPFFEYEGFSAEFCFNDDVYVIKYIHKHRDRPCWSYFGRYMFQKITPNYHKYELSAGLTY